MLEDAVALLVIVPALELFPDELPVEAVPEFPVLPDPSVSESVNVAAFLLITVVTSPDAAL